MSTTDTSVNDLVVNKLTLSQYDTAKSGGSISNTEIYEITDLDTALVRRLSTSAATGGASQGVYVDANGTVQTCDAVTSTYSGTGTAPVNGTAVKSAIDAAIASVYKPAGSVAFANLPSPVKSLNGNVYDVTDAFTTDSKFVNSGESYPAGTNVVVINTSGSTYKYDVLPGFIDLTPYQLAETAVTHTKNTAAGSATQPVYVNTSGVATATTYALNKTVPADAVFTDTNTEVTQNVSTTNATYPILLTPTADASTNQGEKTAIFASGVKVNPSTSTITATTFSGNATSATTATTATKLGSSDVGSATKGIYLDDGVATACTYSVSKDVPADAVFTDTTYSDFVGADGSTAGSAGLVPAPAATDNNKFLAGDGTWATPTGTTYNDMTGAGASTAGAHGLVPAPAAGDNTKFLRGDATWATVDALPSQTSQSGKFLTTNGTSASWANIPTEIPTQTGNSGKFLTTNGSAVSWATVDALPSQTSQSGKFLTTNGTTASWANVDALPSQSGQSGKYLTTDGTSASWGTAPVPATDSATINTNSSSQLQTIGVIEKNAGAVKYDWVGTYAQWQAGRSGGTIPDTWFCWITDDETTSVQVSWSALTNVPTSIQAIANSQGGNLDSGTM